MADNLTVKLQDFVYQNNIHPDPHFIPYDNIVYAVVDCVFSSQAKYTTVESAIERLKSRLSDSPTLSDFVEDIQSIGAEQYATEVLNRQKIARRLKVEVCRDTANVLLRNGISNLQDFHNLQPERAENLILTQLVNEVYGVGPVLARYLLILLGREDHVKPDTLLTRLLADISGERLSCGQPADMERIRRAVSVVAQELGTTPARLDNALWRFESTGRKPLSWRPE